MHLIFFLLQIIIMLIKVFIHFNEKEELGKEEEKNEKK